MNRSPPTPFMLGSITPTAALAAIAASIALPPFSRIADPAADASVCSVAVMPYCAHRHRECIVAPRLRHHGPHGMVHGNGLALQPLSVPVSTRRTSGRAAAPCTAAGSLSACACCSWRVRLLRSRRLQRPSQVLLRKGPYRHHQQHQGDRRGHAANKIRTRHMRLLFSAKV